MSEEIKETPVVDPMIEIKKVVEVLINNFIKAEVGNTVTENNMAGLTMKIMLAMDGQITLPPAKE